MPKPTGFRAMTPGLNVTLGLAEQWSGQTAVPKARAILAFHKTAALLHLPAQAVQLMNKLLSFTRDIDWKADSRPLAWPDNQRLMDQLNISLTSLKRALRVLTEAGLIAFKDSPSGRRVGRRNSHTGKIDVDRSYGIDLSPLGIRTPALEALAEAETQRQTYTRSLAQRFTRDRKLLTGYIEAGLQYELAGPWQDCADALAELADLRRRRCSTPRLEHLCQRLASVLERAQTAYAAAADKAEFAENTAKTVHDEDANMAHTDQCDVNLAPSGSENGPPIQNTSEQLIPSLYKDHRSSAHAEQLDCFGVGYADIKATPKQGGGAASGEQTFKIEARPIDPQTLKLLCPAFGQWIVARGRITWDDVLLTAETLAKPSLQIPDSTWKSACRLLGRHVAATAVALIYDKHEGGLIDNPGAYLNGMLSKAENGELHLPASLFHWQKPRKQPRSPKTSKPWN